MAAAAEMLKEETDMKNDTSLKTRITSIIKCLNEGMHEREEVIAVSLLAALAHQNTFLLGPPGTAKSLIARRLSYAFSDKSYFEYLMQRFSTPEDIFGPTSIAELKKDRYVRKTAGYLPEADFAFLDEIWKSGPAILNSLLTIINEKLFRNGMEIKRVPLKLLITASNETPPDNQGLDALYDRFLVRLNVLPLQGSESFENLLKSTPVKNDIKVPPDIVIKNDEWNKWRSKIQSVGLSRETINIVNLIKLSLEKIKKKPDIYVSDRRWQRAMILIKAAAFFCGRKETNLVDTLLLRHCLWTTKENREETVKIIEKIVRESGFVLECSLDALDKEKEDLNNMIKESFYDSTYYSFGLNGKKCFEDHIEVKDAIEVDQPIKINYNIPMDQIDSKNRFHPFDEDGKELKELTCCFGGTKSYSIIAKDCLIRKGNQWKKLIYKSPPRHNRHKKQDIRSQNVKKFHDERLRKYHKDIKKALDELEKKKKSLELHTPFILSNTRSIAQEGVDGQYKELKIHLQDFQRLFDLQE